MLVDKVKAVTHLNPIMQTCIGQPKNMFPWRESPQRQASGAWWKRRCPAVCKMFTVASAGGGKYMAVLQFKKLSASDEGRQRQAALLAFSAFSELKHVFLCG